jgi:transglutaminase-like putative cysteine protease
VAASSVRRIAAILTVCLGLLPAQRSWGQTNNSPGFGPAPSWIENATLVAGRQPPTDQLNEGIWFVLIDEQVNRSLDQHFHRTIKQLINESGVQNGARLSFDFDPAFEQLTIHHVTIRRGTNVLDRLEKEKIKVIQQEQDLERHIFNGSLSAILFLEDVRAGDQIDYAYTVSGSNPILENHFADWVNAGSSMPIQYKRYRLLWPVGRPQPGIKNHSTDVRPMIQSHDATKEFLWEWHDLPPFEDEDKVPAWYDAYPWLELSDFTNWAEVAAWATRLYPPAASLPPELMEKIDTWKQTIARPEDRLEAALQFVQDEIRYLGFELGPGSYRPNEPSLVFARRFGDCKDKACLLCAILRQMDITASPALVNTDSEGAILGWLPSPYAFDHVVVRAEPGGKVCWVDPTSSCQRGPLSKRYFPDYGCCLPVRPETTGLSLIPDPHTGRPETRITEIIEVAGRNKPVEMTVHTIAEGLDAENLRSDFAETSRDELEKQYLNYYARQYPRIKVTRHLKFQDHPEENTFETTEYYQIEKFWTLSSDHSEYDCEFYPQAIRDRLDRPNTSLRSMPLYVDHPRHEILRTEVVLPEPWPVKDVSFSIANQAAELTGRRNLNGNRLVMEYEYRTLTNCVAKADVPAYIESLREMENKLGYSLTWGNPDLSPGERHVNWTALSLAMVYSVLLIVGAVSLYRAQLRPISPPILDSEWGAAVSHLNGLRGWLILVAIGLVTNPFFLSFTLTKLSSVYSVESWHALTDPAGASYHALWAPVLLFELLANLTLLVSSFLLLILFFQRRRIFPILFIAFMVTTTAIATIDHFAAQRIPRVAQSTDHRGASDVARRYIACLIWIPYMLVSRRVKATFVK